MEKFMLKNSLSKIIRKHEKGQAIILIALAMVGLVAIAGLVTDTGILLIEYGKLKRGVDAAAIAAAQQYSLPSDQLNQQAFEDAAINFLNLNETREITDLEVHSCLASDPDRPDLCNPIGGPTKDNRKLVEVTATETVNFGFLSVIGIRSTSITATAIGEAATLDVVLVIDTSASMAYETRPDPDPSSSGDNSNYTRYDADLPGYASENPLECNSSVTYPCQPLHAVKQAALAFADTLNYGYDRVAIVTLTGQQSSNATKYPTIWLPLTSTKTDVTTAITNLKVFTPRVCQDEATPFASITPGSCLQLVNPADSTSDFVSFKCHYYEKRTLGDFFPDYPDCPSSNVGGALRLAGAALSGADRRLDSFWVVLVLLSGPANATDTPVNYPGGIPNEYTYGYCPVSEFYPSNNPPNTFDTDATNDNVYDYRPCTDGLPNVRHTTSQTINFTYNGVTDTISVYDPDDYARDQADALANLLSGSGVTIYTIGLGAEVQATTRQADTSVPIAQTLLQYIALQAGGPSVNHGQYFYTPSFTDLVNIFQTIAENIATKISQ
jgi:hypothetical protein